MRNRKPVYILTSLFFASFAIIGMLAFLSKKAITKKNGFNRRLITAALIPRKQITASANLIKLIGMQEGKIFLQEESPYEILSANLALDSLHAIKLHLS